MVTTGLVKPTSLFPVLVFPSVLMPGTRSIMPNGNQCQKLFHSSNSRACQRGPTEQGSQSEMKRARTWKKKWHFWGCHSLQEMEHRHPAALSRRSGRKDWRKSLKQMFKTSCFNRKHIKQLFFCTRKQIPVVSECSLSIPFKGSGIPGYRDFYSIKLIETLPG